VTSVPRRLTIATSRRTFQRAAEQDRAGHCRQLLKTQVRSPRVMITDKLASYGAAKREVMPASNIASTRD
jgi:transposase-like protein